MLSTGKLQEASLCKMIQVATEKSYIVKRSSELEVLLLDLCFIDVKFTE
jgi:hypothetical protein